MRMAVSDLYGAPILIRLNPGVYRDIRTDMVKDHLDNPGVHKPRRPVVVFPGDVRKRFKPFPRVRRHGSKRRRIQASVP